MTNNPKLLDLNQQETLLNTITEPRDLALILCLLESDLYVQEVIEIKIEHLDLSKQHITIEGKRPRILQLSDRATKALIEWIKTRHKSHYPEVFIALQDPYDPLSASGINYTLKKWGDNPEYMAYRERTSAFVCWPPRA